MRYPRRTSQHISESESFRILQQRVPSSWLVREVTERDYGTDCYIELVPHGDLVGHLASVQLKGVRRINWVTGVDTTEATYQHAGIHASTVAYWMGLQVPVFLCVADISSREVYWVNVKSQVRANYSALEQQRPIPFTLRKGAALDRQDGGADLYASYLLERHHEQFAEHLRDILVHATYYATFMEDHSNADFFLEVEPIEEASLVHLYRVLKSVTEQLGIEWDQVPLEDRFEDDARASSTPVHAIHEATMTATVRDLAPRFSDTLTRATDLVVDRENSYWKRIDPSLLDVCNDFKWAPPPPPNVW